MSENSDTTSTNVALVRGNSPAETLINGFDHLGGISKFISEGDHIFIKISFKRPFGFPENVNFDTLGKLIDICREAGAIKVYVGDFIPDHINSETLTDITGLGNFLESRGAVFTDFNNTQLYPYKEISLNDKEVQVPALLFEVHKIIILNQVNVHPIFTCTLSYLNLLTLVPDKFQKIQKQERPGKDYLHLDQYKQDLISHILDISQILEPTLVINDIFYLMEGAGPFIYKDSSCKQKNLLVMGKSPFVVDYITLQVINIELKENQLLLEAQDHQSGLTHPENIRVLGESISNAKFEIQKCVSKLEDIEVKNCFVGKGRYCSGCYEKAYYLLNFLKSNMTKDLKYMGYFSFLIGEAPSKPEIGRDIILFGDCAIESTKDRDFRNITIQKKPISKKIIQKLKKSQKGSPKASKKKIIKNKHILELNGCPPDLHQCYEKLIKYYGKNIVPNLKFLELINSCFLEAFGEPF
jgi:uncharacterized protein (DUF362 family)